MKQMSQESSFSDVQLEDPDAPKNSNAGPSHQIAEPVFRFFFLSLSPSFPSSVTVILPDGTSLNFPFIGSAEGASFQASISPADLHGMWYPTVRRTLVCLSKLYRCIDVGPSILKLFVHFMFKYSFCRICICFLPFFPPLVHLTVIWCFSREPSSRVYLKKPYLPASSPCLKPQISSLKTRLATHTHGLLRRPQHS